jgi:hypothetical protein
MAQSQSTRVVATLFLLFGLSLLSGCAGLGGGSSNTPSSAVEVSPANANVRAGDTLQFSAKVSGVMHQSVAWSVNGTVGGNATLGKISTGGLYTAPAALPSPNSVTIEATSASNKSLSGSSAISLENPIPTVTAVSPTAVPVGNFSLTITGTKFVSGAKVMFGGQSLATKFVSATELTATGTATTSQKGMSVQVTVANPDPGGDDLLCIDGESRCHRDHDLTKHRDSVPGSVRAIESNGHWSHQSGGQLDGERSCWGCCKRWNHLVCRFVYCSKNLFDRIEWGSDHSFQC